MRIGLSDRRFDRQGMRIKLLKADGVVEWVEVSGGSRIRLPAAFTWHLPLCRFKAADQK
jgi:hypothetical protein